MATGDVTVTTLAYATMALLNAALTGQNSGAATVATSTTNWLITPADNVFYLTKIVRSA